MKLIYLLLVPLLLCSCSSMPFYSVPVEKPKLDISNPDPLYLRKVRFILITKDNQSKVFSDLEKNNIEPVLFGLTGADYKSLSLNVDDIKSYMLLQNKIIKLYKDYYEGDLNDDKKESN